MEKYLLIAAVIIGAICAVLLVLVLMKLSKKDDGGVSGAVNAVDTKLGVFMKNTGDEFARSRTEISGVAESVNTKLADVTKANYDGQMRMMTLVRNSLDDIAEKNDRQSIATRQTLEAAVEKMTQSNEKKLEEMRATVDEKLTSTLTSRLDSSFKTVSEQLENVYKSLGEMKELSGGVASLNRVFSNVKSRGTWAEYQLENILDQTIPGMYERNFRIGGGIVEFAVRIPSGEDKNRCSYLPIDSKFPVEDYARLCEAAEKGDTAAVEASRKALEARVLDEAKTVGKYICPPESTPFAVLYLATEGLYAEIVSSKSGVLEKIQSEYNIMVAGPSTVTALLSSLAMGFRSIAVNEKANEIREVLGAVKKQYETFDAVLTKVKKKIGEADSSVDEAVKRNDIIRKKLKTVEELDAPQAETVLLGD